MYTRLNSNIKTEIPKMTSGSKNWKVILGFMLLISVYLVLDYLEFLRILYSIMNPVTNPNPPNKSVEAP